VKRGRIVTIIVVVSFIGYVFYSLWTTEPVALTTQLQHLGNTSFLKGTVRNASASEQAVDLDIKYYDSGGHRVGEDMVRIAHLGSGETRAFSAPPRELPTATSFSVYLNHGRNPYGN
jgi:hypothetical protein